MGEEKTTTNTIEQLRTGIENEHRFQTVFRGYDKNSVNTYLGEVKEKYKNIIDDLEKKKDSIIADRENQYKQDIEMLEKQHEALLNEKQNEYNKVIEELKNKNEKALSESEKSYQQQLDEIVNRNKNVYTQKEQKYTETINELNKKIKMLADENLQLKQNNDSLKAKRDEVEKKLENREENEKKVREAVVRGMKESNDRLILENRQKEAKISQLKGQLKEVRADVDDYTMILYKLKDKLKELLQEKVTECQTIIEAWEDQFGDSVKNVNSRMEEHVAAGKTAETVRKENPDTGKNTNPVKANVAQTEEKTKS